MSESKLGSSVEHAMDSWRKALQHDGTRSVQNVNSVAMRRRDLLRSVLSEQEGEGAGRDTAGQPSQPVARPHNYEDFLTRMRSFKSSTWFAKPDCISATQCARFGWINDASDHLRCTCCQNSLVHALDDASGLALQQHLCSAHQATCPWSQSDARSPATFLSPPHSECIGSVLEDLGQRLRDNWARVVPNLISSSFAATTTWPSLGVMMMGPESLKEGTKESLDVEAMLSGGLVCANGERGGGDDCGRFQGTAASVAEYVFQLMCSGEGSEPTSSERDEVLRLLRSHEIGEPADEQPVRQLQVFRAYFLVLHCSLLGLKLQTEAVPAKGVDGSSGLSFVASCPLCEIVSKQTLEAATGVVLAHSHRSFCPHVCGYTPPFATEDEGVQSVPPTPVPPGWRMALECLLAVAVGVNNTENLLGRKNMYFCSSERGEAGTGTRKRPLSPTRSSYHPQRSSSSSPASESPFGIYRKIKCILEY